MAARAAIAKEIATPFRAPAGDSEPPAGVRKPASVKLAAAATIAANPELPGLEAEWMLVTPEQAAEWLAEWNESNRSRRDDHSEAQHRDMLNGDWMINGATLVFDPDGNMLDGQHRCEAIVKAAQAQWSLIVRGIPKEAQTTMDSNTPRRPGDRFAFDRVPHPTVVAALARRWWAWERGERAQIGHARPTHREILHAHRDHSEQILAAAEFAAAARSVKELRKATTTVWGTAFLIFTETSDQATARFFLEHVLSGEDLGKGNPMLALRNRLMSAAVPPGEALGEVKLLYLFIAAWNLFRGGQTVERLQLPKYGVSGKNFPEPY